jgi:hypothetical protein
MQCRVQRLERLARIRVDIEECPIWTEKPCGPDSPHQGDGTMGQRFPVDVRCWWRIHDPDGRFNTLDDVRRKVQATVLGRANGLKLSCEAPSPTTAIRQ